MPSSKCSSCRARVRASDRRCAACGSPSWKKLGGVPVYRIARWAGLLGGAALGAWLGLGPLAEVSRWGAFGLAGLLALGGLVPLVKRVEGSCFIAGAGLLALAAVLVVPSSVWPVATALFAGGVGAWLGSRLLRGVLARVLHPKQRRTLKEAEKLIRRRLRELRKRRRNLLELTREAESGDDTEASRATVSMIAETDARAQEQLARYRAQLWRLGYARWRNEIVALGEDAEDGAVDQESLAELRRLLEDGRRMLEVALTDENVTGTEEGSEGLQQLRETLTAVENLREMALVLVAAREAGAVPSADATSHEEAATEPRIFEALHGEGVGDEFLSSLAELEREHARLESELAREAAPARSRRRRSKA